MDVAVVSFRHSGPDVSWLALEADAGADFLEERFEECGVWSEE